MAGIVDGQAVAATPSNAAWLAKNGNDSTIGIVGLNETASASSGPPIANTQKAINVLIEGVGGDSTTAPTAYGPLPGNTIDGLTHEQALGVIARFFQGATGHSHDGTDGNGPTIAGVVNSIAASGETPLNGAVTLSEGVGITLNTVGQDIEIAATLSLEEVLSVGNTATAGINFLGGAIAGLSYEEFLTAGLPPAYPASGYVWFAASGDSHLYMRTAASATHRVDTSLAASGQTALYGDVQIAASGAAVVTQSGQIITVYAPVAAASGTAVNSIAASGSTALTGAVTLSASGGIQLVQTGQNIQIYSPTGGGSGGTGVNISSPITQTSHGFAVQQCLRFATTGYSLACASADSLSEVAGMVSAVAGANDFTLVNAGFINTFSGLAAGSTYYLSATTAGAIDVNAPSTVGYISKPVFIATAASAGYAIQSRGVVIAPAVSNVQQIVYVKDVKTSGTDGGTFTTGAWQTRTLNTLENPSSYTWASLSSNQITLTAGTYNFEATAPALYVNGHKCKIYNTSDAADAIIGDSCYASNALPGGVATISSACGVVTITGTKTFELQHRCNNTFASQGFGISNSFTSTSEVYSIVKITKLA